MKQYTHYTTMIVRVLNALRVPVMFFTLYMLNNVSTIFTQCKITFFRTSFWRMLTKCHAQEIMKWSGCMFAPVYGNLHRNLQRENLQFTKAKNFVHRIARIWTRLTCHLGCSHSSADGLPSSRASLRKIHGWKWTDVWSGCMHAPVYGKLINNHYRAMHFSAKRGIAIACRLSVRLSVCNVSELWSHRSEFFENNFTIS